MALLSFSHFTLHLFASACLLSYLFINTLLAAYFSLFTPAHCYCPPMLPILYHCFFYTCVLFVFCILLASCMLVPPCTLIVPCTLIAYLPLYVPVVIHSTLVTSSSPVASASWWLYAHSLLWAHFLLLMVHPALCIFTICSTILVWGILVAHLTPVAHRRSLHYVQSQFTTHHFIPSYLLFPDSHSLLYMPVFTYVHLSFCSHFLFVYTFSLVHTHCPTYAHPLIHSHYFFILIDTFVQFHLCLFLFHPHASLYLHLLLIHTFGLMLT